MSEPISKEQAEQIFQDNVDYVYKVALFLTKSKVLADDITQEVFIQVWLKYDTYDQARPFKPWLYQIVLNKTRNTMKRQKYHLDLEMIRERVDKQNIEEALLKGEREQLLWKQVNKLSLKTREVIVMHYYMEMKLEEVAQVLEIPLGTCKSRLGAGLIKLRKSMIDEEMNYRERRQAYE